MMRSFGATGTLIQGACVSPGSPMAQMIAATAWNLNTAGSQITGKIRIPRDVPGRIEHQPKAGPRFSTAGELQRTPAGPDLLLARFGLPGPASSQCSPACPV